MRGDAIYRTCAAIVGAATLAVAGCGGDDDSAGEPLTKAQFITKAAAICREVKQAHQPYVERVDRLPEGAPLERVAPLLEATLTESREGFARLLALEPPAAGRATLDAYFATASKVLDAHARLADAARKGDRETGETVARTVDRLSDDEQRLATAYGLKGCDEVF